MDASSKILLVLLAERGSFNSYELSKELGKDHQQVVGAIKSLQTLGLVSYCIAAVSVSIIYHHSAKVINAEQQQFEKWELTPEGVQVLEFGSHEARVYNAVDRHEGTLQAQIMVKIILLS